MMVATTHYFRINRLAFELFSQQMISLDGLRVLLLLSSRLLSAEIQSERIDAADRALHNILNRCPLAGDEDAAFRLSADVHFFLVAVDGIRKFLERVRSLLPTRSMKQILRIYRTRFTELKQFRNYMEHLDKHATAAIPPRMEWRDGKRLFTFYGKELDLTDLSFVAQIAEKIEERLGSQVPVQCEKCGLKFEAFRPIKDLDDLTPMRIQLNDECPAHCDRIPKEVHGSGRQ